MIRRNVLRSVLYAPLTLLLGKKAHNPAGIAPPISDSKAAMDILRANMQSDPDYAHVWYCNIKMAVYDAMGPVETGSQNHKQHLLVGGLAAERFMKMAFGVTGADWR